MHHKLWEIEKLRERILQRIKKSTWQKCKLMREIGCGIWVKIIKDKKTI